MAAADLVVPATRPLGVALHDPFIRYRERNHLLIVLAPERMATEIDDQLHHLAGMRWELERRDTLVMSVTGSRPPEVRAYAEMMYDVRPDRFTVLLLDKEGSVRMHREQPVDTRDVMMILDQA